MSVEKSTLTRESPFYRRLLAYLHERFPLLGNVLLIVSYYSSNQFLARTLDRPGEPMYYDRGSLLGAITLLCFFFHLRVFDEHKDYEDDLHNYPGRVLQSGLITLRDLKTLGGAAIALELVLATIWSPATLVSVVVAILFSLLMLKEFFVGPWLKRHFLLYAVSHMLVMPLLAMVVYSFATQQYLWQAPGWYWLYAFVGLFVTFNWEISRKIRAPVDERPGIETYTKVFGTYGAAYAVLAIRVVDTGMVAIVGYHLQLSIWFYAVLVALFAACMVGFLQYRFNTNTKTAKRMETYAGMYIIAFDLTLAVELIRKFGITFEV